MSFLGRYGIQIALCGLILGTQAAQAGQVSLADWCVNVNGSVDASTVTDNAANACNGGTNANLASVNTTAFDKTLEPSSNSLGSVTITLGAGNSQYAAIYADYDVDFATFGVADDSGTHTAVPAGYTYELDDPNTSNIFDDFAANFLKNTNNVGTPSGPPTECCDVSWALAIGNINVNAGGTATVIFNVSTNQPASGFYLQQTNTDTKDSIYLTASVNVQNPVIGGGTPEPSTSVLMGLGLAGAAFTAFRRRSLFVR